MRTLIHHHPTRHGDAMMPGMQAASSRTSQPSACQTRGHALQIMPGIRGYSIELAHKGGDTGIRTRHNRMHRKARTGGRCINTLATRISNLPDANWASIFADTYGLLAWALVMRRNVQNGQGTAG